MLSHNISSSMQRNFTALNKITPNSNPCSNIMIEVQEEIARNICQYLGSGFIFGFEKRFCLKLFGGLPRFSKNGITDRKNEFMDKCRPG